MDLFKKKKNKEEALQAEPLPPKPEPEKPAPPLPDSQQLAEARQKAEEQIRLIEQKIAQEREEWAQRLKAREEEGISLRAQLGSLLNKAQQERDKRESTLNLLRKQIEGDLAAVEKELAAEIETWNQRLSAKEKEIEDTKQHSLFAETQRKLESEQSLRGLRTALEQLEQKCRSLERQLLEEQNQWIVKIKGQEEENLNLKTQIALHETRLKSDEEKARTTKREMESAWQEQIRELDDKLQGQRADREKIYNAREEELLALRTALEQRLNAAAIEDSKREKEIQNLRARTEERIRIVENELLEERKHWNEVLKAREEEFKQLKAELVLRESQDAAERERKLQEFKEAETAAQRKLGDIRKKMDAEKESWLKNTATKEEEIKVFKIQMELKLKEIQDGREKRKGEAEQEKEKLEAALGALNRKFAEERGYLQNELTEKNKEIAAYQKEWQERQKRALASSEETLADMKKQNEALEKELADLEAGLQQEKLKWQGLITQKEKELEALRIQGAAQEMALRGEQAAFEAQLKNEQQPLHAHIKELENRIVALRNHHGVEMATKEAHIQSLKDQEKRQEELLRKRLGFQADKLKEAQGAIEKKKDEMKAQFELQAHQAEEMRGELEQKENALRESLEAEAEKAAREKNRLTLFYENQKASLAGVVNNLEKEYAETAQRLNAELTARENEALAEEKACREREERYRSELAANEQEFLSQEAKGKQELEQQQEQLTLLRETRTGEIKAREAALEGLKKTLRDNKIAYQREIETLRTGLENELRPLQLRRQELENDLLKKKQEAEAKLDAVQGRIAALRQEQAEREAGHVARQTALEEKLRQARNDFHAALSALARERGTVENESAHALLNKEEGCRAVKKEMAAAEAAFHHEQETRQQEMSTLRVGLSAEIESLQREIAHLEKEYPQLLEARQEEIATLEKQMAQQALSHREQQEQAEKSLESFQRRSERRMVQLRAQLEQAKERHQAELAAAEQRFSEIRAEMEQKDRLLQEELAREGKLFAEEKYKLEKQKNELEEKLKDLQFVSREQLRQKEKEILALQSELAAKEKTWEENWKQKERELARERSLLVQELENTDARLKGEEEAARRRLSDKENEIVHFQNQYKSRLQDLGNELALRHQSWESTNRQLAEQVQSLSQSYHGLEHAWKEERTAKEKELAALKSNLEFWEQRAKNEEEKRLAAWEEEKSSLESRIKEMSGKLEIYLRESAEALQGKEKALGRLREEARAQEAEQQARWTQAEALFVQQRDSLSAEIALGEKTFKAESVRIEKERKGLEREIEKLKLENALKNTAALADQQKAERKWHKLKNNLQDQIAALAARLAEEKDGWTAKLRIKGEEIETLQVRLTLREERRQAETKRRQEEMAGILKELEEELRAVREKHSQDVPARRKDWEERQKELAAITRELEEKERAWQKEQAERNLFTTQAYELLKRDIEKMEQELDEENTRLAQLFEAKEKQIESLSEQMADKEEALRGEHEHTQELARLLRQRAEEFRRALPTAVPDDLNRSDELNKLFEAAIQCYHNNNYAEAKEKLITILNTYPPFGGAYQYLALCHWNTGQKREARKMAQRALELDPHNIELKLWIESLKE